MTIFSDNPYDRRMEQLMMTVPNFAPRGVGFRFTEAQLFITATAATPTEILTATMQQIRCPPFRKRFNEYIESEENPMTYINEKHRTRFTLAAKNVHRENYALLSVLYLLTADPRLWSCCKHHINNGCVFFENIKLHNCTERAYTLVLDLPHSIYDIYEKLQSIGIMQPPKQIPLTDNEDEDIGVKLFSESDFGQHLILTLNEKNSIADANMLTLVIGAASEDIKEELEQNVLYDQYDSMDEVISAVRQMTQDAGPVKAVFFCPLIGNIDEGDGDMFTVGDSYLADSADEIADALNRYTANDENDMATYYNKDDGVSEKLTSAVWSVELHGGRLFGRIDCSLKEPLTAKETENLREWITGQCSDGLGEGFEQQPIDTMDGELFVSFWNSGDDYAMMTEDEFEDHLQNTEMTMGGM